jgi:molybdate transport system regulatory protein
MRGADDVLMELSARNQLPGKVTATKLGSIMAEVTVEVDPGTVVAAITRASVERLNLQPGDTVKVIVKATEIMIAK